MAPHFRYLSSRVATNLIACVILTALIHVGVTYIVTPTFSGVDWWYLRLPPFVQHSLVPTGAISSELHSSFHQAAFFGAIAKLIDLAIAAVICMATLLCRPIAARRLRALAVGRLMICRRDLDAKISDGYCMYLSPTRKSQLLRPIVVLAVTSGLCVVSGHDDHLRSLRYALVLLAGIVIDSYPERHRFFSSSTLAFSSCMLKCSTCGYSLNPPSEIKTQFVCCECGTAFHNDTAKVYEFSSRQMSMTWLTILVLLTCAHVACFAPVIKSAYKYYSNQNMYTKNTKLEVVVTMPRFAYLSVEHPKSGVRLIAFEDVLGSSGDTVAKVIGTLDDQSISMLYNQRIVSTDFGRAGQIEISDGVSLRSSLGNSRDVVFSKSISRIRTIERAEFNVVLARVKQAGSVAPPR
jgi:predicted RNA-binding Zn-ribbon protein involved in translation (DUF1610 family)